MKWSEISKLNKVLFTVNILLVVVMTWEVSRFFVQLENYEAQAAKYELSIKQYDDAVDEYKMKRKQWQERQQANKCLPQPDFKPEI